MASQSISEKPLLTRSNVVEMQYEDIRKNYSRYQDLKRNIRNIISVKHPTLMSNMRRLAQEQRNTIRGGLNRYGSYLQKFLT